MPLIHTSTLYNVSHVRTHTACKYDLRRIHPCPFVPCEVSKSAPVVVTTVQRLRNVKRLATPSGTSVLVWLASLATLVCQLPLNPAINLCVWAGDSTNSCISSELGISTAMQRSCISSTAIDQLENNLTNLNAEVLREMKLGLTMSLLSSWCRLKNASSQLPPPVSSRAVSCHRGLPLCRGTLRYS